MLPGDASSQGQGRSGQRTGGNDIFLKEQELLAKVRDVAQQIVERVNMPAEPNHENIAYLRAKQDKLGHLLGLDPEKSVDEELGGS